MSLDSDESGIVPDDRPLARPYVPTSPVRPHRPGTPAWPHTGPATSGYPGPVTSGYPGPVTSGYPGPDRAAYPDHAPVPAAATDRVAVTAPGGGHRREDRGPRPLTPAVLGLLALASAGAVVFLLSGPEPEPPRAQPPAGLSVPGLPGRSPGASQEPADPSARPPTSASTAPKPSGPTASQSPKPTPSPTASAGRGSAPAATLRMGDRGPQVSALQELLFAQGFTYVSVSGVYDGQTKRGVSQLQRDRDIDGDPQGVYGPATRAALD